MNRQTNHAAATTTAISNRALPTGMVSGAIVARTAWLLNEAADGLKTGTPGGRPGLVCRRGGLEAGGAGVGQFETVEGFYGGEVGGGVVTTEGEEIEIT